MYHVGTRGSADGISLTRKKRVYAYQRTIIPGSVAQEVKAAAAAGPRPLLWEARRRRLATPGQIEREEEFYNKAPSHNTGHGTGAHWHRRNEEVEAPSDSLDASLTLGHCGGGERGDWQLGRGVRLRHGRRLEHDDLAGCGDVSRRGGARGGSAAAAAAAMGAGESERVLLFLLVQRAGRC